MSNDSVVSKLKPPSAAHSIRAASLLLYGKVSSDRLSESFLASYNNSAKSVEKVNL